MSIFSLWNEKDDIAGSAAGKLSEIFINSSDPDKRTSLPKQFNSL